jgi:hypothetical protein
MQANGYYATLLIPLPSSTCCLNFPHSLTATIRCLVVISYFSRQYFASGDSGVLNCGGGAGKTTFLFFSIRGFGNTYYKNCSIFLVQSFFWPWEKKLPFVLENHCFESILPFVLNRGEGMLLTFEKYNSRNGPFTLKIFPNLKSNRYYNRGSWQIVLQYL